MEILVIKIILGCAAIAVLFVISRIVAMCLPDYTIEETADIFGEKYRIQRESIEAIGDDTRHDQLAQSRSILDSLIEKAGSGNDDVSRWKPGGREAWEKYKNES